MESSRIRIILLISIIIIFLIVYIKNRHTDVTYVKSFFDGQYYLVRDLPDKEEASNLLATINKNIFVLTNYLYDNRNDKYKEYLPYIEQLHRRIKNVIIIESSGDSVYTSYTINKGEQIIFCLRSRKAKDELHELNLIMYVVLHEISHIACPEYNHTPLFIKIFTFFTTVAIELGLYKKINFDENPTEYCGLIIPNSVV